MSQTAKMKGRFSLKRIEALVFQQSGKNPEVLFLSKAANIEDCAVLEKETVKIVGSVFSKAAKNFGGSFVLETVEIEDLVFSKPIKSKVRIFSKQQK